jgi:nitroimidazol reductase NimA-like FMN-containing flavoprotein (pyridoxamine 5'-phosphate oxidase superfamily)
VLPVEECRQLLGTAKVGRVVLSIGALPAALPVNYLLVGDSIQFFTGTGSKLDADARNTVVGFEVDRIDEESQTGWSVLAVGPAAELTDPQAIDKARKSGLRPWAADRRNHLIRLDPQKLTGRRVSPRTSAPSQP